MLCGSIFCYGISYVVALFSFQCGLVHFIRECPALVQSKAAHLTAGTDTQTLTALLCSPDFFAQLPHHLFSQFQALLQIRSKDFPESNSAPDRNLTHELLTCWWKELLGNKNWRKELLENKNSAITDSVSDRFFYSLKCRGEKIKMKIKNFILDCVQKFIHLT